MSVDLSGGIVRVSNVGDRTFRGKWSQRVWVIEAGTAAVVPVEAAKHWLGDWDAVGDMRKREVARLRLLYGAHFSDTDGTERERWERNRPMLECYLLSGDRITTVVDDPEGTSVTPTVRTEDQQRLLEEQIQRLQAQLAAMQSVYDAQRAGRPVLPAEVTEDRPRKVKVSPGA